MRKMGRMKKLRKMSLFPKFFEVEKLKALSLHSQGGFNGICTAAQLSL